MTNKQKIKIIEHTIQIQIRELLERIIEGEIIFKNKSK